MHIRSLKRTIRNRRIFWSVAVLAIVVGGAGYWYYNKLQASQSNKPVVATTTIGIGDIVLFGTGSGSISTGEAVPVGFKNGGQVTQVLVNLGDKVTAGQVLARLDTSLLTLQYEQAAAKLAALSSPSGIASAQQAVQDAKSALATAKDSLQELIGPDLLIAEDNANAAQQSLQLAKAAETNNPTSENQQKLLEAEAALTQANARLAQAQNDYTGKYVLQKFIYPVRNIKGVTTSRELFAPSSADISIARAAYDLATANLQDTQNYLDVLTGSKTIDQVPASSVVAITEAKMAADQAKANLDAAELVAPIDGTVTSITLNVGDMVGTSSVATISVLSQPYTLNVQLDETDWDKAQIGNDATVTFDMLPNKNYPGKVIAIYPVMNTTNDSSTAQVIVRLNNAIDANLPAGATASVDITGGKALGVTLAPITALKQTSPGNYVVYLMKNGQPVEQLVEVGLKNFVSAEITSGLKRGDVVLTNAPQGN